jgi:UDP-2,3-diacylglucosamine pyrophosphatase LpxH
VPTPETINAYTNRFGPDYYAFRHGDFIGVVLNSSVIHSPQKSTGQLAAQEQWLKAELERTRAEKPRHLVVFQHHPWCLASADEADQYFNIPRQRRERYLSLFREYGVKYLFCGHYHRNAVAKLKDMEVITTGPVGKPLGDVSGLRVAIVRDDRIDHRYYHFGEIPNRIELTEGK